MRGARFTVEVAEDGTTQIDLQEGTAEVHIEGQQALTLDMGKRITLEPDGEYKTEQLFEPDTAPAVAKVTTSWNTPDDVLRFELTEAEVNQFLAAMSDQPDFFLRDAQVWFLPDEARIAATLVQPTRLDLSASLGVQVVRGRIEPQVKSIAAGVALPVPRPVLDLAIEALLGRMENYLDQAYDFVEFDQVRIEDGSVLVTGRKRPDAPLAQ